MKISLTVYFARCIRMSCSFFLISLVFYQQIFALSAENQQLFWTDYTRTLELNASESIRQQWNALHLHTFASAFEQKRSTTVSNALIIHAKKNLSAYQLHILRQKLNVKYIHKLQNNYIAYSKSMNHNEMESKLDALKGELSIDSWEPLQRYGRSNSFIPNDPLFRKYQWNLTAIQMTDGWTKEKAQKNVLVAVVDSGIDANHPDLKSKIIKGYNAFDPSSVPNDQIGHGTHVAGIIAATINNTRGVAGMARNVKILPVKVLDDQGNGDTYSVSKGIMYAVDAGADVINLSLGDRTRSKLIREAILYAISKDVIVIAAAGNEGSNVPDYPGSEPEVVNVTASDESGKRASYANYGNTVDIMAPGSHIVSTFPGGYYASLSGTSMASPHVAALAAMIRAQKPTWSREQVINHLLKSATKKIRQSNVTSESTIGMINAPLALQTSVFLLPHEARLFFLGSFRKNCGLPIE